MNENVKQELLQICIEKVEEKAQEIFRGINQAQEAIESDTKSSAGDKYETSREMVQQDLNRYYGQLDQAKRDLNVLQRLELQHVQERIQVGSLVVTDLANYFISVSLGRLQLGDTVVMVISGSSPIGKLLLERQIGDSILFDGKEQRVLNVL